MPPAGSLLRVPASGGEFEIRSEGGWSWPGAVATSESHVYWSTMDAGQLLRQPLAAGAIETVFSAGGGWVEYVVASGSSVAWTASNAGESAIWHLAGEAESPTRLWVSAPGDVDPAGRAYARDLAADAEFLYWVHLVDDGGSLVGSVNRLAAVCSGTGSPW